jgi:MFS superfamily sulfate permease-like transporter
LGLNLDYGVTEAIMNIAQTNRIALAVFAGSMVVLQLFKRFVPAVPGAVVVTVVGILIGKFVIGE